MRYHGVSNHNEDMAKNYPMLNDMFDENNELCGWYLGCVSTILCSYISSGRNVLVNYSGVGEQAMHTDYDPTAKFKKTLNNLCYYIFLLLLSIIM